MESKIINTDTTRQYLLTGDGIQVFFVIEIIEKWGPDNLLTAFKHIFLSGILVKVKCYLPRFLDHVFNLLNFNDDKFNIDTNNIVIIPYHLNFLILKKEWFFQKNHLLNSLNLPNSKNIFDTTCYENQERSKYLALVDIEKTYKILEILF